MNLISAESIKLFSTRSPWWCNLLAMALPVGFATAAVLSWPTDLPISVTEVQLGYQFGMMLVLVMAALAVTTEYRFGTMRTTFQAVPGRTPVLLAKTVLVAGVAGLVGLVAALGSLGVASLLHPVSELGLGTAHELRAVLGVAPVFVFSAVIAVAVGLLVRQSAGALAILLVWPMLVEPLVSVIPTVGEPVQQWMPFMAADHFLRGASSMIADPVLSPAASLAYFGVVAVGLLAVALVVARRRDA
ncbi:ABC transporter permease [Actinoalloteichus spitiensis]|uniref:ABC transporter permease n=1 Tax=Actinoalloteichus spitiensis TaxID=252394 RepID=UPI0003626F4B|nr:ABC transporter permease [Actinoalloteichus spitiensis]